MNIFIKTCKKDFEWLEYCLKSIMKYGTFNELVIVCDLDGTDELKKFAPKRARIHSVCNHSNGYVYQQIVKLSADLYTKEELILFVDSDCVFFKQFSVNDFMVDGKPLLLKTKYTELAKHATEGRGNGTVWKEITEKYISWKVDYEYMRRLPIIFRRDTIVNLHLHMPDLMDVLHAIKDKQLSEFNILGAFADKFEQDKYTIIDTEDYLPPKVAEQFWSWGGISDDIRKQMEKMIQ